MNRQLIVKFFETFFKSTRYPIDSKIRHHVHNNKKQLMKRVLALNFIGFGAIFTWATVNIFTIPVWAAAEAEGAANNPALAAALIGAGIATGLACVGAGIATGSAASAAIGAVSENENMMGKALIFVAMAEGIAIYGLLIAFMILNRI